MFVDQPSILATNSMEGTTLAAGSNARDLIGRSPDHVALHKPLANGVISDSGYAGLMIRHFIDNARKRSFPKWHRMAVTFPCCGTRLERRAIIEAATLSGASKVFLVPNLISAAIGAGLKINSPRVGILASLGGGICEVGIVGLGHIIYSEGARFGGETFDYAIHEYLLHSYNIQITMDMAEKIKRKLAYAESSKAPLETMRITGREAGRGGLKNIGITSTEISKALEAPINSIIDLIQEALDNASPAVLADLENFPIVLVGGLSLLHGLPTLIAKMTGFQVVVATNPLYASLKGCSTVVDDPSYHVYCMGSA